MVRAHLVCRHGRVEHAYPRRPAVRARVRSRIPRPRDRRGARWPVSGGQEDRMASTRQKAAARKNIAKAASAARRKRTIAKLSKRTRTALGKEGAKAAKR